jgi:hypothetical protein
LLFGRVCRSNENNGSISGSLPFPDKFGRLKSIHVRHADIQEDHSKVPVEEQPEGFLA